MFSGPKSWEQKQQIYFQFLFIIGRILAILPPHISSNATPFYCKIYKYYAAIISLAISIFFSWYLVGQIQLFKLNMRVATIIEIVLYFVNTATIVLCIFKSTNTEQWIILFQLLKSVFLYNKSKVNRLFITCEYIGILLIFTIVNLSNYFQDEIIFIYDTPVYIYITFISGIVCNISIVIKECFVMLNEHISNSRQNILVFYARTNKSLPGYNIGSKIELYKSIFEKLSQIVSIFNQIFGEALLLFQTIMLLSILSPIAGFLNHEFSGSLISVYLYFCLTISLLVSF